MGDMVDSFIESYTSQRHTHTHSLFISCRHRQRKRLPKPTQAIHTNPEPNIPTTLTVEGHTW